MVNTAGTNYFLINQIKIWPTYKGHMTKADPISFAWPVSKGGFKARLHARFLWRFFSFCRMHYKKDIATLERVQRKAARFCSKNYSPTASVTDMIKDLEWESLEIRRKKARLALLYKFSHNLIDVSTDKFLQLSTETRTPL